MLLIILYCITPASSGRSVAISETTYKSMFNWINFLDQRTLSYKTFEYLDMLSRVIEQTLKLTKNRTVAQNSTHFM